MNNTIKKQQEQIIIFLKASREANRKDIGKQIGEQQYSDKLKAHLNYLVQGGYIKRQSTDEYSITPYGDKFVSFEEEIENEKLAIRLAKSNIEANEFQKQMTRKNHKWMIVNIVIGSILCLSTVIQVLLTIL